MIPAGVGYALLRHFHSAASTIMVATASLRQELAERGFRRLGSWGRGVDNRAVQSGQSCKARPARADLHDHGRVAVEKNLEAFLSLDLPGTKVVIGDGPQRAQLAQKYPDAVFLGEKKGADLTAHLAAADVFRVSEPHRHLRRGAARGAGLRHTSGGVPGHRPQGRHCRSSDRRAGQ